MRMLDITIEFSTRPEIVVVYDKSSGAIQIVGYLEIQQLRDVVAKLDKMEAERKL